MEPQNRLEEYFATLDELEIVQGSIVEADYHNDGLERQSLKKRLRWLHRQLMEWCPFEDN